MPHLTGFDITWQEFSKLDPVTACRREGVSYDDSLRLYTVRTFGQDIFISNNRREVFSDSITGNFLLGIKDYFFDLSILWYLIGARDVPLSGELVKPSSLPGGQIFAKGTHVLPMDEIAQRYNNQQKEFVDTGNKYGAVETDHGDVGLQLLPFPRVPVYLIIWFGDEDFPPRGQLLVDSTCSNYLSTDVIWAVTMVCCQIFLLKPK